MYPANRTVIPTYDNITHIRISFHIETTFVFRYSAIEFNTIHCKIDKDKDKDKEKDISDQKFNGYKEKLLPN